MNWVLQVGDFIAFTMLWWASVATLAAGSQVRTFRAAMLTFGLIATMAFSFACAVAASQGFVVIKWWGSRGVIYSCAVLAAWLYDHRFGIIRHARMAATGIRNIGQKLNAKFRTTQKGKKA